MELTAREVWGRVQEIAKETVPAHAFSTWIASAKPIGLTDEELLLEAQNRFHVEWLEDKFGPFLASAAERVVGRPIRITVSCAAASSADEMPLVEIGVTGSEAVAESRNAAATPARAIAAAVGGPPSTPPRFNERYTFDRFVVGVNNQLAAAACRAVAEQPARTYNPLFLYGGVGLGKTHLMQAIGHEMLRVSPEKKVCYVSTEQFTNDLVTSIRNGTTAAFRARYRAMDLLLVDDAQFLGGKDSTQEEFFHTFNTLYDAQKQIVLTSDRPPHEMAKLEERLVSRFEWGLVVDMRAPDYETRVAILRKKAEDDGLALDDDVIDFIAHSFTASVRELEGAIIKLLAFSSLTNQELTPAVAHLALRDLMRRRQQSSGPVQSPERIRELVARRWRVREDALSSKRRTKDVTVPRQVAMYLIKETLGLSLSRIGDYFGGRDHSTVIHSIRKVEKQMEDDETFRDRVEEAREELKARGS